MITLENVEFIQQEDVCCCPASIEIVLNYYGFSVKFEQNIWNEKLKATGLSFFKAAAGLFNRDTDFNTKYFFRSVKTTEFVEWKKLIIDNINNGIPVIISTPVPTGWHITVIYGYDTNNFLEMCPIYNEKILDISNRENIYNSKKDSRELLIITKI